MRSLQFALLVGLFATNSRADDRVDFATQVAPLFAQHCLRCHSPGIAKGEISLATEKDLRANEYVVPGRPDESHLVDLITPTDDAEMPKDGVPLSTEAVALIRRWIEQGAEWPDTVFIREPSRGDRWWWSLQSLSNEGPPDTTG